MTHTRGDYAPRPHARRFSTELTSCSDRPVGVKRWQLRVPCLREPGEPMIVLHRYRRGRDDEEGRRGEGGWRGRGARSNLGLQGTAACAKAVGLRGDIRGGGRSPRGALLLRVLSGSFFDTLTWRARLPRYQPRYRRPGLVHFHSLFLRHVFPSLNVSAAFLGRCSTVQRGSGLQND